MKNKEIEELLNDMRHSYEIHEEIIKKYNNADKISYPYTINLKQIDLLLSYIEQLENNRDKAIDKIQLLIDIGFDYDGFNKVESLKGLIDELVSYARESRDILKGDSDV